MAMPLSGKGDKLEIVNQLISPGQAVGISNYIDGQKIKVLSLSECGLRDESFALILKQIVDLQELSYMNNEYGKKSHLEFSRILEERNLKKLTMSKVANTHFRDLTSLIVRQDSLVSLHLTYINLDDAQIVENLCDI